MLHPMAGEESLLTEGSVSMCDQHEVSDNIENQYGNVDVEIDKLDLTSIAKC
jgi:hypothetical protein